MNIETLKAIGWFLLGVGVLLIGVIGILFYIKTTSYEYPSDPFYAFCEGGYIKIKAYKDLHNVKILLKNQTICEWNLIRKGISKVCDVTKYYKNNITIFLVKANEGEDIVKCFKEIVYLK